MRRWNRGSVGHGPQGPALAPEVRLFYQGPRQSSETERHHDGCGKRSPTRRGPPSPLVFCCENNHTVSGADLRPRRTVQPGLISSSRRRVRSSFSRISSAQARHKKGCGLRFHWRGSFDMSLIVQCAPASIRRCFMTSTGSNAEGPRAERQSCEYVIARQSRLEWTFSTCWQ